MIHIGTDDLGPTGISRRLEETPAQDDVFSAAFRHDILVAADSQLGQDQLASIRQQLSDAWGSENVVAVESSSLPNLPRDGPYVLVQEKIFRPYRLYDDIQAAFVLTTRPDDLEERAEICAS